MRWRLILLLPVLLALVLFAVSNTTIVPIGLWPTDLSLAMPLSAAILGGMALAFLVGALSTWLGALPARRRARRAEAQVARLQAELAALRTAPVPAPLILPAA